MIMSEKRGSCNTPEEVELRRGPWTLDEDTLLIHYIACHGEGRWNLLARCSGLKRTGKSCRLRWLNYLKPDIKRGNLSIEEQLLILDLHSKWGNRWSRIAQHLPGRTDNEIKNYWRTRVQKQARQLKIDANSSLFRDAVRCYWIPRLIERRRMQGSSPVVESLDSCSATIAAEATPCLFHAQEAIHPRNIVQQVQNPNCTSSGITTTASVPYVANFTHYEHEGFYYSPGSRDLQAKLSAAPATLSHSMTGSWNGASTIYDNSTGGSTSAHSMWSMDELYGMLQNYMESNP